jgi:ankyrin repeat protein
LMLQTPPKFIKELIKYGADVNAVDPEDVSALMYAVQHSHDPEVIKALVKAGAKVNYLQSRSALHIAVMNNDESVKALIDLGADVNILDDDGIAPFQLALYPKYLSNLKLMIKAGAKVNYRLGSQRPKTCCDDPDCPGYRSQRVTALHTVVRESMDPLPTLEVLVEAGADVNAVDEFGLSVLYYALTQDCEYSIVECLVKNGAIVPSKLVFIALCYQLYYEIIELLLQAEGSTVDISTRDDMGMTILGVALLHKAAPNTIELLLAMGADVQVKDNDGSSLLCNLSRSGSNCIQSFELLIQAGIDINKLGSSALMLAIHSYNKDTTLPFVECFLKAGIQAEYIGHALCFAIKLNLVDLATLLFRYCGDLNKCLLPEDVKNALRREAKSMGISRLKDVGLEPNQHDFKFCANCRNFEWESLGYCSGCHLIAYCNKTCQKAHWRQHKVVCKNMKKLLSKSSTNGD